MSFFLEEGPIRSETVKWRQVPESGAGEIEAQFLTLCRQYRHLESWCDSHAACELPAQRRAIYTKGDAETLANRVRRDLGLGDTPAVTLLRTLEEGCGLKVFHLDFEPTGTAACSMADDFGGAVLLNSGNPRWRRNFDLAHELFHLLTWEGHESDDLQWSSDEEGRADTFAAHLLMPSEAIRDAVNARRRGGKLPLAGLFEIARQFDVSIEALAWRIHNVFAPGADPSRTRQVIGRAKDAAAVLEERERDTPPSRPARFRTLALTALRRGEMSAGRFAEYMGVSRNQAMRYLEVEVEPDESLEIPGS